MKFMFLENILLKKHVLKIMSHEKTEVWKATQNQCNSVARALTKTVMVSADTASWGLPHGILKTYKQNRKKMLVCLCGHSTIEIRTLTIAKKEISWLEFTSQAKKP